MKITSKKKTKPKKPSLSKLMAKLQVVFNSYIRSRDSEDGYFTCISCSKDKPKDQMNAGHYVPVKGCANLRFNEWNVNGECISCNGFDEFHLIGYRRNLIEKIGADAVKWLEDNRHTVKKWTCSEIEELISYYSDKLKQLKAA
jgi:hypothetical protein